MFNHYLRLLKINDHTTPKRPFLTSTLTNKTAVFHQTHTIQTAVSYSPQINCKRYAIIRSMDKTAPTLEELLTLLKLFKQKQGEEFRLQSIGVFGSFARNEATPESDVDIVFTTDDPNLFRTARMKEELEELLSRHIDLIRWREQMNPRLQARIAREARYV